jgi:AraC-like DNA-binding protein
MMLNNLSYEEQVKHFNAVMSRALDFASDPLLLGELEVRVLSCHRTLVYKDGFIIPEHEHPNYELTFMEVGEMVSYCDNYHVNCTSSNNNILFIPPAVLHHRNLSENEVNINLSLVFTISGQSAHTSSLCSMLADSIAAKGYCMKLTPPLDRIIQELKRQTEMDMPLTEVTARHLLFSFIALFFQQNFPELFDVSNKAKILDQFDFENNRIEAIKRVLVNLMNRKTTLKSVEERFGMSARHLNRIFKHETGMTISQYQTKQKPAHARNLLSGTSIPVSEISHSLGFNSPVQFSCFFQRHQNCSPSLFRNKNKTNRKLH